jgi:hypothetical protein
MGEWMEVLITTVTISIITESIFFHIFIIFYHLCHLCSVDIVKYEYVTVARVYGV